MLREIRSLDLLQEDTMSKGVAGRVLVIDDNPGIHEDFAKILLREEPAPLNRLDALEAEFLGTDTVRSPKVSPRYTMVSAFQGREGYELAKQAVEANAPYDVAFVDMRMPPGWDGLKTVLHLWKVDPTLQIVICTAYSDYSWQEISQQIGSTDNLLILKKPFDIAEVSQLASTLTEKRRLARAATAQRDELKSIVEQRTRELSAALEEAKQANVAKSAFLANMSYEIRTPLTSILGYADCFLTGDESQNLTTQQTEAVDTITRSGRHLLELINSILDLSKIEANKLKLQIAACDLNRIVAEVVESLQVQADSKGICFHHSVDDHVPTCLRSDAFRLKQILINLCGNAIKFTNEGSVRLHVRQRGERLEFSVQDTGIGIPSAQQLRIFESFTQADASLTRSIGGTGLGLTISQRLAKMLGGEIRLVSEVGVGSEFTLVLPHHPDDAHHRANGRTVSLAP